MSKNSEIFCAMRSRDAWTGGGWCADEPKHERENRFLVPISLYSLGFHVRVIMEMQTKSFLYQLRLLDVVRSSVRFIPFSCLVLLVRSNEWTTKSTGKSHTQSFHTYSHLCTPSPALTLHLMLNSLTPTWFGLVSSHSHLTLWIIWHLATFVPYMKALARCD